MIREDSKTNIFQDFLLDYFASNQEQWDVYAKSISLEFLREYSKNFDFMLRKLKELNKKNSDKLTRKDWKEGEIISNIITLREMIKVSNRAVDFEIRFKDIDETFVKVENEDELAELNKVITTIDNEELKEQDLVAEEKPLRSFQRLNFYYVYLISFVKEEQFRKDFYRDYLEDKNIITNINPNLANSSFISAV